MRSGHTVRTCLTDSAQKFVTPALFEALTSEPCLIDAFEEPERGRMAHIDWAKWADVLVIAPATANTIAKLAYGVADDMLSTVAVASSAPLVVAPAMNPAMYGSESNQAALKILATKAVSIVEPIDGDVACGDHGQGKLATIAEIAKAVEVVLTRKQSLKGKRVLITSGPTQEPIDDVRFLTNKSSGKMGAAIARAALLMGAEVVVIAGPSSAAYPLSANVVRVRTAEEMLTQALHFAPTADLIIGAAAVADYRPEVKVAGKLRRKEATMSLQLVANPDVIAEVAKKNRSKKIIGFAAEPSTDLSEAQAKLARKGLHAIAVNDVSNHTIGFDSEENELQLIFASGETSQSGHQSKLGCALWLLESVSD